MDVNNLTLEEANRLFKILVDTALAEERKFTAEEMVIKRALASFKFYCQDAKEFDNYTQLGMPDRARRAASERDKNYQEFLEHKDALAKWAVDK
jgi:hypothetical protein